MLDGRTVLVTGASSGIGRTTALHLAQLGANVLAGVRTPEAGEALGPTVTPVRLDVTRAPDVAALAQYRLDGLVNNAGIAVTAPLEFLPVEELRRQLEINVIAQLAVTQACMPALRATQGRIVNVSSIAGRVALPLYGPYAASKFALEALSDALRREQQEVGVILVEPGSIATPIWDRSLAAADALYAAMPPIAHERYDALVAKLRGMAEKQGEEGEPPEAVARVIATALSTARPRTRYVVGNRARVQAALARALSGRAMDKLLARAIKT
ncbi:SDR family NAD(P)-dependent oxidoreductase [Solirubrobacter ginsenosidimutans]|uniref:SDR family NAD(P)-dependent oxidoreductase n=1 Tax=Solirubrobacter ginsenosidimutans TaxID=490573 RepID=A0A9X3N1I3_9ACTN|nr:SDR family NAD(P)-dependent oxidoreductase [Solirubrobacter ginsenosidimutans]MDA0166759.1 SDR family NAD(P)-dependent oxidoreductase [Solirubrobacter ginsenosidimutans]